MKSVKFALLIRLVILPLLVSFIGFNVHSQEVKQKVVQGDTTFWKNYGNTGLVQKFNLADLTKSNNDFSFRLSTGRSIIDLTENSGIYQGRLITYISRYTPRRRDTLFEIYPITPVKVEQIIKYLRASEFASLPNQSEIKGWERGLDGTTFTFELADKYTYQLKSYWSPSSNRQGKEAIAICNLLSFLQDTLNTSQLEEQFMKKVPKSGCYNTSSMTNMCYTSTQVKVGYYASTHLPLGYTFSYCRSYIGKAKVNLAMDALHQFDNRGNSDFSLGLSTNHLFFKKSNDFLYVNYRNRNLSTIISENQNIKFLYGKNMKPVAVGIGADFLRNKSSETVGGLIYLSKWFQRNKVNVNMLSSIFKNHLDYRAELGKTIYPTSRKFFKSFSLNASYERFHNFNNIGFGTWFIF